MSDKLPCCTGCSRPMANSATWSMLASSDASVAADAREFAAKWQGGMMGTETEPGATPQSHEVVMTLRYISNASRQ